MESTFLDELGWQRQAEPTNARGPLARPTRCGGSQNMGTPGAGLSRWGSTSKLSLCANGNTNNTDEAEDVHALLASAGIAASTLQLIGCLAHDRNALAAHLGDRHALATLGIPAEAAASIRSALAAHPSPSQSTSGEQVCVRRRDVIRLEDHAVGQDEDMGRGLAPRLTEHTRSEKRSSYVGSLPPPSPTPPQGGGPRRRASSKSPDNEPAAPTSHVGTCRCYSCKA